MGNFLTYNSVNRKHVLVLFILTACVFHLDKIILGPYAPIRMHDIFESDYGRYLELANLILKHGFFSWNPNIAGGMPSYAYHFGPTHLWVLLSTVFPLWFLYHFHTILLMTLAGYGMYRFIEELTDAQQKLALLGGLFFALITQLPYYFSYPINIFTFVFPFFFLCLHSSINTPLRTNTLASRFFWLILFAWSSHPILTIAYPVLHLALIFFLTPNKKKTRKQWLFQFSLYWVGYSLLFLPSVSTLLDFIPFDQRVYPAAINSSIPLAKIFYGFLEFTWYRIFLMISIDSLLFPVLISSIPLIIVSKEMRRFFYLVLIFVILAGISGSDLAGFYTGTFLEKMETRLSFYLIPFTMVLYGVTVVKIMSQQAKKIRFLCIGFAIGSLVYLYNLDSNCCGLNQNIFPGFKFLNALITLLFFVYIDSSLLNFMTSSSTKLLTRNITWSLVLLILCGTLGMSKFLRFVAMENKIYKRHFESHSVFKKVAETSKSNPFRVAMIGNRPTIAGTYGLEYTGGRGNLFNKYYKDYFKLLVWPQLMGDPKLETFFDTYNFQIFLQVDKQSHPEFKYNLKPNAKDWNLSLLMALNVKYVISNRIIIGMNQHAKSIKINSGEWYGPNSAWALKPWEIMDRMISSIELMRIGPLGRRREPVRYFIYEMKDYFQRAYLASRITVLPSRNEVLAALGTATIKDLRSTAYLAKEDVRGMENFSVAEKNQLKIPTQLEFLTYEPDQMTIQVTTQGPRMLVVSTNYDPKWKAFVNGQETKVIRTNHAFQGILLPVAGKNRITLSYSDPVLLWSFIAIPFGVLLVFAATKCFVKPSEIQ